MSVKLNNLSAHLIVWVNFKYYYLSLYLSNLFDIDPTFSECRNFYGSYDCHCKPGYVKDEGSCVLENYIRNDSNRK